MLNKSTHNRVVFLNRSSEDNSEDAGRLSETHQSQKRSSIRAIQEDDVDCAWSIRFSKLQDQFHNRLVRR